MKWKMTKITAAIGVTTAVDVCNFFWSCTRTNQILCLLSEYHTVTSPGFHVKLWPQFSSSHTVLLESWTWVVITWWTLGLRCCALVSKVQTVNYKYWGQYIDVCCLSMTVWTKSVVLYQNCFGGDADRHQGWTFQTETFHFWCIGIKLSEK